MAPIPCSIDVGVACRGGVSAHPAECCYDKAVIQSDAAKLARPPSLQVGKIWFDGRMVPQEQAQVSVLTHALHYGTSVFEGIRAYDTSAGTAVFRLHEHVARLFDSAKILRIEIPFSPSEIEAAICQTVRDNGYKSCYIRPLAWLGDAALGVDPFPNNPAHVMVAAWEWGPYLGKEAADKGATLITSSWARLPANALPGKAKAGGNYVNSVMAKMEAIESGAADAILLDSEGFVAEGTGENVFFVKSGVLYALEHSVSLMGITRDSVLSLAKELGIPCEVVRATRDQLYIADELFICGTAAEITPVSRYDHRMIGNGQVGPITQRVQQAFSEVVAGRSRFSEGWLTRV